MHTTTIAGIPHRKPNLSVLKIGDSVDLRPEPDNKFDPNAIQVIHHHWTGSRCPICAGLGQVGPEDKTCVSCAGTGAENLSVHLGYIPRMETGHVAGVTTMYITAIQPGQKWKEVTISTEKPEAD